MLSLHLNLECIGFILLLRTLAQTGINAKPSLSAWPSHIVPQGQNVTLTCDTHNKFNIVMLYKEHGDPKLQVYKRMLQRSLLLGPVTRAFGGTYRCYSYTGQHHNELSSPSEPLKIIISGIYRKPFLLALPTPLVKLGEKVILKCLSEITFDTFTLTSHRMGINKNSHQLSAEIHMTGSHANFPIGPVTPDHAGTYTCYGSYKQTPYELSESSDPVDIKITGLYKKPSLSALMGTVVTSGENMILSCISDHQFDMFHLSMKGVPQGHGLPAEKSHSGTFQANFLPVPLIQAETYRCYGSFRNSSHVWSFPSDPLYLSVSDNHGLLHILIRLSLFMIAVFLIFIIYSWSSAKGNIKKPEGDIVDASSLLQHPVSFILALPLVNGSSTMLSLHLNLVCTGFILLLRTLAQAGINNKPSLSAWPSHIVPQGQNVTFTCDTHSEFNIVKLYKEHGNPNIQGHNRIFRKDLLLGPVTPAFGGTYRCYSYKRQYHNDLSSHSDPLKIIISGIYRKPFLLALPTPLVKLEEKVTLKCHSEIMFDTFILTSHRMGISKDSFQLSAETHIGGFHANFPIGPVTPDHAGTYTCYGSYKQTPYEWSESSDPVDIKITGLYKKPSLSALMGPVVTSEENMTLSCISDHQFDMFHLSMKGVPQGRGLPTEQSHNGTFKANFFPVPLIQAETYRCYGSFRNSSHVWSSPSDPLYLSVTVNSSRNFTSSTEPDSKTNNHRILNILIGLSVTMLSVFLIILLYSCCSAKKSKSQEQASECHLNIVRNQDWRKTAYTNI
uniref:immunoglobulin superfamily member 1-like n=1 Tax=Myodes glareolus TaxID=447135 RepID=UPI002021D3F5|nr:immunoglobulin superfamily member 1-like [Myodes glareolus]